MTATQKQVKRALYNGLPNLSDRELRQMIDRELEKDSSQIDMNYIDTCFDLMEMHADSRITVQPRRKWLKAVIVAALIAAATVSAMSVSAHLFNFNIPSEIAHKINGSAQIDPNLAEADTSAAGYALTASPVAKQLPGHLPGDPAPAVGAKPYSVCPYHSKRQRHDRRPGSV